MKNKVYLLDANVFIRSKNLEYSFDICPGFWSALSKLNDEGKAFTIEQVYREVSKDEDLLPWFKKQQNKYILSTLKDPQVSFQRIATIIEDSKYNYNEAAKQQFLKSADFFLIAWAMIEKADLVTHEKKASQSVSSIKIPDICEAVKVECINPYEMLRQEGAVFVLSK